jgi:hypothetical protein
VDEVVVEVGEELEVTVETGEKLEVKVEDGAGDKCQSMRGTHQQWRFWGNHGSLRW